MAAPGAAGSSWDISAEPLARLEADCSRNHDAAIVIMAENRIGAIAQIASTWRAA